MFVRIIDPDEKTPLDFELDFDYSHMTPEIQQISKDIIYDETGIQPELQNAVFCPESTGMQNIKKPAIPKHFAHLSTNSRVYPEVYEESIVHVESGDYWKESDLRKPENRAEIKEDVKDAGTFVQALYRELDSMRTVSSSTLDEFPDFRDAIEQSEAFHGLLEIIPTTSHPSEVTRTELKCYDDILHRMAEGISAFPLRQFDTNQMHTQFFASMMMHLPFFADEHPLLGKKVDMAIDNDSGLHMFVNPDDDDDDDDDIHKVTLQSNIVVYDRFSRLPTLICEVDFHASPKNRARIFLQGLVACRQWRYVLPESIKDENRFLGLFVHDDFNVDLYLFHAGDEYKVELLQERFVLEREYEAVRLARILFNYRDKLLGIAGNVEQKKFNTLKRIVTFARIPPSLSPSRRNSQPVKDNRTDPFLFSAQVESPLCPDGASIQATEHENVAVVRMSNPPFKPLGFIKVANESELDAFEAIRKSGSQLLLNRVILPTKIVEASGYTLAYLPYGGEALEYSWGSKDGPLGHEVEIAWDLFTIVSHLHQLGIAHLDVKPTNILWDLATHSIRVIDFDSSEIVDPNGSQKIKGPLGTSGYMAPEVESEEEVEYDPFLADAYSCGLVIQRVVIAEKMSEERWFVHGVAKSLSEDRVDERLSINKAIESWVGWLKERGRPVYENRLFG